MVTTLPLPPSAAQVWAIFLFILLYPKGSGTHISLPFSHQPGPWGWADVEQGRKKLQNVSGSYYLLFAASGMAGSCPCGQAWVWRVKPRGHNLLWAAWVLPAC
jgi:hypothetical protein